MKAVIMAGGKGTRLRPLTAHIPKPMVPILNKPCMSYSIGLLKRHGITEIAVTVQHLAPQIKAYFGDGSDFGVSLHYFDETKPLGTAGSVRNAASYLNERFVVISGDALTDYDLSDAIHFHEQKKALATILMAQVDFPLEYGVIMTDEQGIVTRFIEKPSWREVFSDTVNTGIYILEPDIFNYYESHIEYDFSKQLFPLFLDQKLPLFGYHATGYWSDIGNLNSYRQTQFDMLQGKVNLPIDAHEIAPQVFVESGSQIESGVHIKGPALIGANSQIKSDTVVGPFTVIGSHNLISTSASIEQSILWDSNVIMEAVQIEGATICSHNKIGTSSRVLEGGVLGNGCHIGPHVNIHEQVKLWPKKNIQANAEVTQSIVWGERESVHMFNRYGLSGVVETEMTPELVSKISASLSYYYQPGRTLVLSCVDHGYASVIKRLLIAGLQARGIHVVDIGIAAHSVHSYAIQSMQLDGGLHLFIEAEAGNPRRLCIQCYDKKGICIDEQSKRTIEKHIAKDSYMPVMLEDIGEYSFSAHVNEAYLEAILSYVSVDVIKRHRYKVLVALASPRLYEPLTQALKRLDCTFLTVDACSEEAFSKLVQMHGANVGIMLKPDEQSFSLFCDRGSLIIEEYLWALQLMMHQHEQEPFILSVPSGAPSILEVMGKELGTRIRRTKESLHDLMSTPVYSLFHPMRDPVYTLSKLLQYLAFSEQQLSQACQHIPDFHMVKRAVFCPLSEKGKVMRLMLEEMQGKNIELLDGIKLVDSEGWVLILPHTDGPGFHVISQGNSEEIAVSLAQSYEERIKSFQKN